MAYGRKRTGTGRAQKTCNRCGKGELAWLQVDGVWKLFGGQFNAEGKWEADASRPHACTAPAPSPSPAPAPGVAGLPPGTRALRCTCGVTLWAREVDVLQVGYPVCSGCGSYFEAAA